MERRAGCSCSRAWLGPPGPGLVLLRGHQRQPRWFSVWATTKSRILLGKEPGELAGWRLRSVSIIIRL